MVKNHKNSSEPKNEPPVKDKFLKSLLKKHREFVLYALFGIITTAANILTYHLCLNIVHLPNVISNIIAWITSVIIAFITNKIWVFGSTSWKPKVWITELNKFVTARLITGALDLFIMWLAIDVTGRASDSLWCLAWKIITNVIVILLNYIFSKLYIFSDKHI